MKKHITSVLLLFIFIFILIYLDGCRKEKEKECFQPIRAEHFATDEKAQPFFRKDQILVAYKNGRTPEREQAIRDGLKKMHYTAEIQIQKCDECKGYIELWIGKGIHSVISTEGITSGSGRGTRGTGEDSVASYSLNFIVKPPDEKQDAANQQPSKPGKTYPNAAPEDTVLVAVLDSGIDTTIVDPRFLWTNKKKSKGSRDGENCYPGDRKGWNFVSKNSDITDDSPVHHGSIVAKYIVDAFQENSRNFIQILPLKTHDSTGYGDLFGTICAIHYAVDKGANIINASWGFYYYESDPHPYLTQLIKRELGRKGILFIAAAGNKMDDADNYAKSLYLATYSVPFPDTLLRNLSYHNFYPACLSDHADNVITVTTSDTVNVSPTQNFHSRYVTTGVFADVVTPQGMKFKIPIPGVSGYISGSSFATPIFAGHVAANLPKSNYIPGIDKALVLQWLEYTAAANAIPLIVAKGPRLESRHRIDRGRYIRKI